MAKRIKKSQQHLNNEAFTYSHIEKDESGWVDATKYKPRSFDLINLKTNLDRVIKGWWTGQNWCGVRIKDYETVFKWRRTSNEGDR